MKVFFKVIKYIIFFIGMFFLLLIFFILNEIMGLIESQTIYIILIIGGLLYILYIIMKTKKRVEYFNKLLVESKLDLLLIEIDKDINKLKNNKYKAVLLFIKSQALIFKEEFDESINVLNDINLKYLNEKLKQEYYIIKSILLSYKGEFKESINMLNNINKDNLDEKFKQEYYNRNLYNLLMLNKLDEAKVIFVNYFTQIQDEQKSIATKKTIGVYEFYMKNLDKSKEIFEEILTEDDSQITPYYFLGLIYLKEEKFEESIKKLKKAADFGKGSFISEKAKELTIKVQKDFNKFPFE